VAAVKICYKTFCFGKISRICSEIMSKRNREDEADQAVQPKKAKKEDKYVREKQRRAEKAAARAGDANAVSASKKKKQEKKREENIKSVDISMVDVSAEKSLEAAVEGAVLTDAEKKALKEEKKKAKKEKKEKRKQTAGEDEAADHEAAANENMTEAASVALADMQESEKKKSKKSKSDKPSTSAIVPPVATTNEESSVQTLSSYQEHTGLKTLPQKDIDDFLAAQFISISDPRKTGYRPITEFKYLPTGADAKHLEGFKAPSPIQAASWPFLLAGRDAIGIAETGSGKTMAFGVPCVRYVTSANKKDSTRTSKIRAVIVSPTRELAQQIFDQLTKLVGSSGPGAVCIYGGVPKDEQRAGLRTASIIVATPGRLNDFIQEGAADLSNVGFFVLDEADRMLDKGFEAEIKKIAAEITKATPQTVMFTATWPPSIRELAATFMKDPVRINIGQDNPTGDLRANVRVTQKVEVVDPRGKEQRLLQLLKQYQSGAHKDDKILVFCLYKKEATRVEGFIASKGLRVAGIHGDLGQNQRTASLEAFKSGKVPLLVATDVAARGLDIPNVKVVINVTFPLTVEDYVHRIGRTGRAGQEGLAVTLFTEHDKALSGGLINVLKAAKQAVPEELMKFGTVRVLIMKFSSSS